VTPETLKRQRRTFGKTVPTRPGSGRYRSRGAAGLCSAVEVQTWSVAWHTRALLMLPLEAQTAPDPEGSNQVAAVPRLAP
jgi:hypothetical protein